MDKGEEPKTAAPTRRKRPNAEPSRAKLVAAATRLFAERGYQLVTIDEIAHQAGISRGSIFWHFGSKATLLQAVLDDTIIVWGQRGLAAEVGERRGLEAIRAALRAHRNLVERAPMVLRLHHLQMADALGPRTDLAATFVAFHRQLRLLVTDWIQQAIQDGEIAGDIDPPAAAVTAIGAVSGMIGHWLLDPAGVDLDRSYAHLEKMILHGLGAGGSTPQRRAPSS